MLSARSSAYVYPCLALTIKPPRLNLWIVKFCFNYLSQPFQADFTWLFFHFLCFIVTSLTSLLHVRLIFILGVFAAAHDLDIKWIVIKGISDYAGGSKSKEMSWRPFASLMAASVTAHILSDANVFQDWPHFESTSKYWTVRMRSLQAHFSVFSYSLSTSEPFILFLASVYKSYFLQLQNQTVDEKWNNPFANVRLVNQVICLWVFRLS